MVFDKLLQVKEFGFASYEGHIVDAEGVLKFGVFIEVVEGDVSVGSFFEFVFDVR